MFYKRLCLLYVVCILSFICIFQITYADNTTSNTEFNSECHIRIMGYIHNMSNEIWCINEIAVELGNLGTATCYYDSDLRKCVCYDMYLPAYTKPSELFSIDRIIKDSREIANMEYEQKLNVSATEITELEKKLDTKNFIITFSLFVGVFAFGWLMFMFFYLVKLYPNFRWRLGD